MTVRMITGKGKNKRVWELVEEKKKLPSLPPPPKNELLKEGDIESRVKEDCPRKRMKRTMIAPIAKKLGLR